MNRRIIKKKKINKCFKSMLSALMIFKLTYFVYFKVLLFLQFLNRYTV